MIDLRDHGVTAVRMRYGKAMMKASKLSISGLHIDEESRHAIMEALRDIPILIREIQSMAPKADEIGKLSLNNELLKEEVKTLEEVVNELRYEVRLMSYSGA